MPGMVPAGVVPAGMSLFSMALSLPPRARADIRTSPDLDPDPDPGTGLGVPRGWRRARCGDQV